MSGAPTGSARPAMCRGVAAAFVDACQRQGRYSFTDAELAAQTTQSALARRAALRRLQKQGRLLRPLPRHDFFVIVPHEYHAAGAPPSSLYLDALMRYLGMPEYYVGLMSAAQWWGVECPLQRETQVIVPRQMRAMQVGWERIRFFTKHAAGATDVQLRQLDAGMLRVSSAEATAIDLVSYTDAVGGLNQVVRALKGLRRHLNFQVLKGLLAAQADIAAAQRLGYLLECAAGNSLVNPLARWLKSQHPRVRALDARAPVREPQLYERWRLWINAAVE